MTIHHLLIWESDYGDEGDGRAFVATYSSEAEALHAAATLPRPYGFPGKGSYEVAPVEFRG